MEALDELGYEGVQAQVIDAAHFVPQHRERIFIVGFRKDTGFSWNNLELPPKNKTMASILEPHDQVPSNYVLSEKLWLYLQNYAKKHKEQGNGFGFGLVGPDSVARTLSARYYKDGSEILVDRGKRKRPRRLTPLECARLMGYVKPGQSDFVIPVSDTQAYKQFGNSVVVPVISTIARMMKPHIEENKKMLSGQDQSRNCAGQLTLDIVTPDRRSRMMAGIRNRILPARILVRKALFRRGFRYSLGGSGLPGKPDLVFKKHRAVLFVNGCFWHGHGCHLFKWPSSNREFWQEKISANISRDQVNIRACLDNGYRVATVWECAIKGKFRQP